MKNEVARAWQVLLLEGKELRPEAKTIMADLERFCDYHGYQLPLDRTDAVDPLRLAASHSRRGVFAYINQQLKHPLNKE